MADGFGLSISLRGFPRPIVDMVHDPVIWNCYRREVAAVEVGGLTGLRREMRSGRSEKAPSSITYSSCTEYSVVMYSFVHTLLSVCASLVIEVISVRSTGRQ